MKYYSQIKNSVFNNFIYVSNYLHFETIANRM